MYKVGDIIEGCRKNTAGIEREIVEVYPDQTDDNGNKCVMYLWRYVDGNGLYHSGNSSDPSLDFAFRLKHSKDGTH